MRKNQQIIELLEKLKAETDNKKKINIQAQLIEIILRHWGFI